MLLLPTRDQRSAKQDRKEHHHASITATLPSSVTMNTIQILSVVIVMIETSNSNACQSEWSLTKSNKDLSALKHFGLDPKDFDIANDSTFERCNDQDVSVIVARHGIGSSQHFARTCGV